MKIALEVDVLASSPKTGVFHYTQRLLRALLAQDTENDYSLVYVGKESQARRFELPLQHTALRAVAWLPRKLYRLSLRPPIGLPIDLLAGVTADIWVFTGFSRWPLLKKAKSLTFIYDTAYIDYPEVIETRHFQAYLSRVVPRAIRRSTKVLAISESTKQSLIKHYQTPTEKIEVITPGVDHSFYKAVSIKDVEKMKTKYSVTGDYVLYLGTLEPRKNIVGIIEAYRALSPQLQAQYQLVLAGNKGWQDTEIEAAINSLPEKNLVRIGYVDHEDLPALYTGSTIFLYPSVYEGWGMQILEAQACGTPVITADNSSLPEAGGEAAIYVKTGDQMALNQALCGLLQDPARRKQLSQAGLQHVKGFTWEASATKLRDLLEELGQA